MDLTYSPDEAAFRDDVRGWIDQNLPADPRDKVLNYRELSKDDLVGWHKTLAEEGLDRAPLAEGVGRHRTGPSCSATSSRRSAAARGAPPLVPFGVRMCAPVLLRFGTAGAEAALPARHLQRRGLLVPGLLGARRGLRPRVAEDARGARGRSLRGQRPEDLDHARALRRLDLLPGAHRRQDADKRQDGISFLLIDMKSPGITVRPIMLMDGGHEVNEVFFDEVKVPAEQPRARGGQGLDGGEVPARPRAHGHRQHRGVQARAGPASRRSRRAAQGRHGPCSTIRASATGSPASRSS